MTDSSETRILRVSLDRVEPEIWRVFEVAGLGTLGWLHETLIGAMGWGDCHLHSFTVGETTYSADFEGIERIGDDEEIITISDALPEVGSSIRWLYDWGDNWDHTVPVIDTGTMKHGTRYPILYDGARACPPEDCGGTWGYMEILAMHADPDYEPEGTDREGIAMWLDPDFNPDFFDQKKAERRMRNPGTAHL